MLRERFEQMYQVSNGVFWNRYIEKYACQPDSDEQTVRECEETNKCWELVWAFAGQPIILEGGYNNATSVVGHVVNDTLERVQRSLQEIGFSNVEVEYA